jgi:hypothetical protein
MPMNRPARRQAGMLSPIECTKIGLLYFFNRYKPFEVQKHFRKYQKKNPGTDFFS